MASGLVRDGMGLGGLGDGDGAAEGLELADVVADFALLVDAAGVVAAAEVVVAGGGVGEQVPVALCRPSLGAGCVADFAWVSAGPAGWPAGPAGVMAC
jgi:hypothetical protein